MIERVKFRTYVKKLQVFAHANGIDIICKINNPRKIRDDTEKGYVLYTPFEVEVFPLEPETYLDGKRYPYYPDDPKGLAAYTILGAYWRSLGGCHHNDAFRSWFEEGAWIR
jgi:hypothetical protein